MRSLLSDSVGEEEREKKRRQHLLEKFEVSPLSLLLAIIILIECLEFS